MTTLGWLIKTGTFTERSRRMAFLKKRKKTKEILLNSKIKLLTWTQSFSYFYIAQIRCRPQKISR